MDADGSKKKMKRKEKYRSLIEVDEGDLPAPTKAATTGSCNFQPNGGVGPLR
jgi:hypothetical protein